MAPQIEDYRKEIAELKELMTQIRICIAKLDANQSSFKDSLNTFRDERLKTYDLMTTKIEEVEKDVHSLDKKITYAAGIVTAAATFFSFVISSLSKKLGLA